MTKVNETPRFLTEKEAAAMVGLSPATLRVGRCTGPRAGHVPPIPFVRIGRGIRYDLHEVLAWMEARKAESTKPAA